MGDQELKLKDGVHIIVATPGRLVHFLNEKKVSLAFCRVSKKPATLPPPFDYFSICRNRVISPA
mgnify:CR=1 FL=1